MQQAVLLANCKECVASELLSGKSGAGQTSRRCRHSGACVRLSPLGSFCTFLRIITRPFDSTPTAADSPFTDALVCHPSGCVCSQQHTTVAILVRQNSNLTDATLRSDCLTWCSSSQLFFFVLNQWIASGEKQLR